MTIIRLVLSFKVADGATEASVYHYLCAFLVIMKAAFPLGFELLAFATDVVANPIILATHLPKKEGLKTYFAGAALHRGFLKGRIRVKLHTKSSDARGTYYAIQQALQSKGWMKRGHFIQYTTIASDKVHLIGWFSGLHPSQRRDDFLQYLTTALAHEGQLDLLTRNVHNGRGHDKISAQSQVLHASGDPDEEELAL